MKKNKKSLKFFLKYFISDLFQAKITPSLVQYTQIKFSKSVAHLRGFTLAEVLITLSILGIVAAITIPNITRKYQRKTTIVKVKKMYSMLSDAYQSFLLTNNNEIDFTLYPNSAAGSTKVYNDIFAPYLQISYDAGTDTTKNEK